jgi:hypothetical protein
MKIATISFLLSCVSLLTFLGCFALPTSVPIGHAVHTVTSTRGGSTSDQVGIETAAAIYLKKIDEQYYMGKISLDEANERKSDIWALVTAWRLGWITRSQFDRKAEQIVR